LKDDIDCFHQAQTSRTRTPDFKADEITGAPHLEALYEHHRPNAGWQRESHFLDGTLRLLGILWSLLNGDSLLLIEEPELNVWIRDFLWRRLCCPRPVRKKSNSWDCGNDGPEKSGIP
jgi:hypothetical protein